MTATAPKAMAYLSLCFSNRWRSSGGRFWIKRARGSERGLTCCFVRRQWSRSVSNSSPPNPATIISPTTSSDQ
jgi:hypothetical protein